MTTKWMIGALLIAFSTSACVAADDLESLFESSQRDFGRVQHGSTQTHKFVVKNTTQNDLHIQGVSVSCGCVTPSVDKYQVKPGESATVLASMDTSRFYGSKTVTVFVTFSQPVYRTVSLRVSASSEDNVPVMAQVNTMEVDLGTVAQGEKLIKKYHIEHTYPDWKIISLQDSGSGMKGIVKEISREGAKVRYELAISLPESLATGTFTDKLKIQSNDPSNPEMVVVAKAMIEAGISVSPNRIQLDDIAPGTKVTKTLVLKSPKPFSIVRAEEAGAPVEIRTSNEKKTTQLVTVTFTMPADRTKLAEQLRLVTDNKDEKPVLVSIQR